MKTDNSGPSSRPKWKQWLIQQLDLAPQTPDELLQQFQRANDDKIITADTVEMMQGVMQFTALQVRDVMMPRPQVHFIYHDDDFSTILQRIAETEHSRYPVVDENRDDLVGVLLAKDMLRYFGREHEFDIDDIVRPAMVVPETQPLNRLLAEFRDNRSHMAVVIDEYSGIAGLVTMEDLLEQIVGDIDDEHDGADENSLISVHTDGRYVVQGITPVEEFNESLGVQLNEDCADTVAGVVINTLGKIPAQGEELSLQGLLIRVLRSDSRRVLSLEVMPQSVGHDINNHNEPAAKPSTLSHSIAA